MSSLVRRIQIRINKKSGLIPSRKFVTRLPKSDGRVDLRPRWSKNADPAYRKI